MKNSAPSDIRNASDSNKIAGESAGVAGCRVQVPRTYGMHPTKNTKFVVYQQGMQGADLRVLGHMEGIRLKKNFLVS